MGASFGNHLLILISGFQAGFTVMCGAFGRQGEYSEDNRYLRVFTRLTQHSEDHRGTPEAPGRVVTLIERSFWEQLTDQHATANEKTWGMAYRIKPVNIEEVRSYLDLREINGYTIHYTTFHPADATQKPIRTLAYIGTPDNPQFTGPQDSQQLAEHIWRSRGPSGENKEYLFLLEAGLESLNHESGDEHVQDLASRVRALERSQRQLA